MRRYERCQNGNATSEQERKRSNTHRHKTEKMISITFKEKMLAMPSAKQRKIQITPVLLRLVRQAQPTYSSNRKLEDLDSGAGSLAFPIVAPPRGRVPPCQQAQVKLQVDRLTIVRRCLEKARRQQPANPRGLIDIAARAREEHTKIARLKLLGQRHGGQ